MSRVLVDTNVWLWMALDDERLGTSARRLVDDPDTELLLSAVSAWELTIKWSLGKIALPAEPTTLVDSTVRMAGLIKVPISFEHVLRVADLPPVHADPFDRLLIAQAEVLGVPILTGDRTLARYAVPVIDATR